MLRKTNFLIYVLSLMLICTSPATGWAQRTVPNPSTWVTDGMVNAITCTSTTIYLGGNFNYVGPFTGSWVPLSAATGKPAATFPKVVGVIFASAPDGAGGWYIGGSFTMVGGVARNHLAHVRSDASVDSAWNPNADNTVYALKVSGGTVYAGGNFTSIGGQTRNHIAALNATTGHATAWNPNANGEVMSLAVSGATVYTGGRFTSIGGQTRSGIAALNAATGLATGWNPDANNGIYSVSVNALAVSEGTVYAGGVFVNIGGQPRISIAALDATTGKATAWNPSTNVNGVVLALEVSGGTVYVGGYFNSIGGQARINLAALNAATGQATAWNPSADDAVYALVVSGTTVYAGGYFSSIGGQARVNLAALDAATGQATAWNPNAGGTVCALAVSGGTVYAGGYFNSIGGQKRDSLAALDAATGQATAWNPKARSGLNAAPVHALAVSGGTVYVGGNFSIVGGKPRNCIAAVDAVTGQATDWNPNASGTVTPYVYALAVSEGVVYAGGSFTNIGKQARNRIAALDSATGLATSWDPNASYYTNPIASVHALAVSGGKVYVGGYFNKIGGKVRSHIAALDATTGQATDWDPNAASNSEIYALMASGSTIYVGGRFTGIGGKMRNCIAALSTVSGKATDWDPNAGGIDSPYVNSLAVSRGTVYAGGRFTSIGGKMRSHIAGLDATTGLATDWNHNANGNESPYVHALATMGGTVYAGGSFTTIGGQGQPYIVRFDMEPSAISAEEWGQYR